MAPRPASAPLPATGLRARFDTQAAQGADLLGVVKNTAPKVKGARSLVLKSWKFQVERNYELLTHPDIPEELLDDREFLFKLARVNISSVTYMPSRWQLDRGFILAVMRDNPEGWRVFDLGLAEHCNDRGLLLAAVKGPGQGWRAMRFASPDLQSDTAFMLDVAGASGAAVEYATSDVKAEDAVVLASIAAHAAELERLKKSISAGYPLSAEKEQNLWLKDLLRQTEKDDEPAKKRSASKEKSQVSTGRRKVAFNDDAHAAHGDEDPNEDSYADVYRQISRQSFVKAFSPTNRASMVPAQLLRDMTAKRALVRKDTEGEVLRVVQLCVLDLKLRDGTGLVHMGSLSSTGRLTDKCVLPGHKFSDGVSPKEAVTDLLNKDLRPLREGIVLKAGHKQTRKTGYSNRYRCKTQYNTFIFSATLDPAFQWMDAMKPLDVDAVDIRPRLGSRPHESFCRRFCVEGSHARPDMFQLRYRDPLKQWPPITCPWPPKQTDIYAWLPPWEVEWLTTSLQGSQALKTWMSQLTIGHQVRRQASRLSTVESWKSEAGEE